MTEPARLPEAIYNTEAEAPADDRRSHTRARAIFAYGKLSVSGAEQICQIRDISPQGLRVESREVPLPGQRVTVEMRGMPPAAATVVWREGDFCGLALEAEQDLDQVFNQRRQQSVRQPRGPRFSLKLPARFASQSGLTQVEVMDISMGGLKLAGDVGAVVGSHGLVRLDGIAGELYGHIRWIRDGMAGFRFDRPMQRDDLFNLLNCRA